MKYPNPLMLLRIAQGDAYGMAVEYIRPEHEPLREQALNFESYGKHPTHKILAGQYTDDTQMSIGVAEVIGVSRDSLKSHANFSAKQELTFPLISDADEAWCQAFDVIHEKVLYGKRHLGIVRSTFLIDPDGKLSKEWRGVKVPGHAQAVLDAIPSK